MSSCILVVFVVTDEESELDIEEVMKLGNEDAEQPVPA